MKQPLPQMAKPISRRAFLSLTGALSLGVATIGIPLPTEAAKFDRTLYKVSKSHLGMGTFINIMTFHPSPGEAQDAIGRAFEEIYRLSHIMSRHQSSSQVSHLNSSGTLNEVPPDLLEVLRSSLHYHGISQGTFDVTIKPVVDLYQESFRVNNRPPSSETIKEALERVGSQHLQLTQNSVSFGRSGMEVTLDGIAKGYIVDRAMDLLRRQNIQHALINAGGDILVHGGKGEGKPWKIGIQDPWRRKGHAHVVTLDNGAIATSGNYEVFFDREKLFHHLIRPNSGIPAPETASVTIRAASCMEADAMATSVYVMGPARGKQFIRQLPSIEGLVISSQRKKMPSPGWKRI